MQVINGITGVSIYEKVGNRSAIAEASIVEEKGITPKGNIKTIYYFNRIVVPCEMDSNGIGSMMLDRLLEEVKLRDGALLCDINPYGRLGYCALREWYIRHGFREYLNETNVGFSLWYNA